MTYNIALNKLISLICTKTKKLLQHPPFPPLDGVVKEEVVGVISPDNSERLSELHRRDYFTTTTVQGASFAIF